MSDATASSGDSKQGMLVAIAAYTLWGLAPIFWKLLSEIEPTQLIAHRVIWALPTLALIITAQRSWSALKPVFKSPKALATLFVTTTLIVSNWFIFVYAIITDRILDTSLGYFINPLVFTFMGFLFLGERLPKLQSLAVGIATLGVAYMAYEQGSLPWISLALAFSFATYGVLRKKVPVTGIHGLTLEVGICFPVAIGFVIWLGPENAFSFSEPLSSNNILMMCAGPVTAIPLLLFNYAIKRIKLATVGFLQYIAPTMTFGLGVFVYGESFSQSRLIAFIVIWIALAIYSLDAFLSKRSKLEV